MLRLEFDKNEIEDTYVSWGFDNRKAIGINELNKILGY